MEVSIRDFAKKHGVSHSSVHQMIKNGRLGIAARQVEGGRWFINEDLADGLMTVKIGARGRKRGSAMRAAGTDHLAIPGEDSAKKLTVSAESSDKTEHPISDVRADAERLVKAQADEKEQLALLAEIKVRQQQGLLMEREQVSKEVFKIARMMREGVTNIPGKVAPEIAAMDDPFAIQKHLERQFRDVLTDLSNAIAKLGVPDADQPV